MSGDTSTCGVHLDGAFRFMTQARTWKSKFSPKAIALHRIYFYLRAIYESTALDQERSDFAALPPGFETPSDDGKVPTAPRPLRLTWSGESNVADICPSGTVAATTESGMQMSTYECIYGVPQNLLVLFFKTTRLVREVTSIREKGGRAAPLPLDLSTRCDTLEQIITDWSIDLELERCRINGTMGASYDIIHQTTHAFHNALIIYFAQHVRLLSYRYLQSYVQTVLESIEAIEEIKAESRILAAPIYWPAFIAASEAFNEGLQARFRSWYDQVEVYGIEANRSGISVLNEVWKRGPVTGGDLTSRWRMVVNETRAHLMLS
jgi:arginine metabolism regulation protein II